ncbi:MAG: type II toxin-antitoxin system RelE/ParE family toxin [Nitrospirae bacterium]|nr:type II toxin-antitoxin system RelE/ParE family toxin [Nitrospirota bacterium]
MEIRRYTTASGRCPVDEYLDRLQKEERAEVIAVLESLSREGLKTPLVSMRHIDGKLWELRISRTRIFYVVVFGNAMVLLHAYKKQGQKAPHGKIRTALQRMADALT